MSSDVETTFKPKRDPIVSNCCGCISLRTGVMVLASLWLVCKPFILSLPFLPFPYQHHR
ncbi:hypothetical protein BC829DRAFT_403061 [Chytridium lagenaria]|nr:hypothetical protein BC829DRAFT_403061 [Chytridium lagenaria]